MKIVAISDTHGMHKHLEVPLGDMLIHAGDVCNRGTQNEAIDFIEWFSQQAHKYKIFIAGNHDSFFENASVSFIKESIPNNVIYLNDSGITIEGIHIWGSPIQPEFFNWAFNRNRGEEIAEHWKMIPQNTDILITHGPPFGILDLTADGKKVGCQDLLETIQEVLPKYHIFGHIHEAAGQTDVEGTYFINASSANENYRLVNEPIVFNY